MAGRLDQMRNATSVRQKPLEHQLGTGASLLKNTKSDQVIAASATEASRVPSSRISP
jgi:hypothetical protein